MHKDGEVLADTGLNDVDVGGHTAIVTCVNIHGIVQSQNPVSLVDISITSRNHCDLWSTQDDTFIDILGSIHHRVHSCQLQGVCEPTDHWGRDACRGALDCDGECLVYYEATIWTDKHYLWDGCGGRGGGGLAQTSCRHCGISSYTAV